MIRVTPQLLVDHGIADHRCHELIVTATLRERKALLEQRGDAFVALPGGLGTFEEVFEILVGRTLGYHAKPVVLLNVAVYYAPLLAMLEHGIEHGFIHLARTLATTAWGMWKSGSVYDPTMTGRTLERTTTG